MSLLKKLAAAAAKKAIIAKLIGNAPDELRPALEQLCADAATVNALKTAFETSDKKAFTAEQVATLDLPELSRSALIEQPELLNYLNTFIVKN